MVLIVLGAPVDEPAPTTVTEAYDSENDNWIRSPPSATQRLYRFASKDDGNGIDDNSAHTIYNAWGGSYTPKSVVHGESDRQSLNDISTALPISPIYESMETSPIADAPKPVPVSDIADISKISESN